MFRYILILLIALIAFSSAQYGYGYGPYYEFPHNPGYGAYGGGLLGLLIGKK